MDSNGQKKEKFALQTLTDESGAAIVIVDENSNVVAESNNNSMCRLLYASGEFASHCTEFCGRAFAMTAEAGKPVEYECYAGLSCLAVPLTNGEQRLTAIVGRTFLKAADYRQATERVISGDWQQFPPEKFFENALLDGAARNLEKTGKRLENLSRENKTALLQTAEPEVREIDLPENRTAEISSRDETAKKIEANETAKLVGQFHQTTAEIDENSEQFAQKNRVEIEELAVWRSLFSSLLKLNYRQACDSILDFLGKRYDLNSMMWLERRENRFETILAIGVLEERKVEIGVSIDDARLLEAALRETSLELRERQTDETEISDSTINLFPVAVGGEIRSALVVGDELSSDDKKRRLAHFCRTVASELEILRLREELIRRSRLTKAVGKFNESLKNIDTEDFWLNLTQISAELLRAERASLLVYDEKNDVFEVRANIGASENLTADREIGNRVARRILQNGNPLIAVSASQIGIASIERNYKTDSFIVYPVFIGSRKLAVLNFTDRADGEAFNEFDLELLQAITPQIAVAIDRADLKNIAGKMEQLSVTDPLTGLLNRRYLDERLIEEIKRSNRYGYPMSFVMIDIDDFGRFNKDFGVLTGDEVLRRTVEAMIKTLRGADVAARYGGEEFCVLLPQTTLSEGFSIAERIRTSIEKIEFSQRQITVSIGVTTFSHEVSTPETIIKTADDALRTAKRKGKNNVQVFGELSENLIVETSAEHRETL